MSNNKKKALGKYIQHLRTKRGWAVEKTASELRIGLATLYKIEEGDRPVRGNLGQLIEQILCSNDDERLELTRLLEMAGEPAPASPLRAAFQHSSALSVCP